MSDKTLQCPLCNNGHFDDYLRCKDHRITQEFFTLKECQKCNLKITVPKPSPNEIVKYYESDSYEPHGSTSKTFSDTLYNMARYFTLKKKLKLIQGLHEIGSVLDMGCGTGEFLNTCKKSGWKIAGIEPGNKARNMAIRLTGTKIYESLKGLAGGSKFDVISLWHVLEHVQDLQGVIQVLIAHMDYKGWLILAVPNCESWDANYYGEEWAGYDVPRHLYHFKKSNMSLLAHNFNLRLRQIIPMKLDAFYVSLLSERYRSKGVFNPFLYFKALRNGIRSNRWAAQNESNYSSLIYIFANQ